MVVPLKSKGRVSLPWPILKIPQMLRFLRFLKSLEILKITDISKIYTFSKSKSRKSRRSPNWSNLLEFEKFRKSTTVVPFAIKSRVSLPLPILEIPQNLKFLRFVKSQKS